MKTFLVTGGNGYIGSHMCQWLNQKGHKVLILDDKSSSPQHETHKYGTFFSGDIADKKIVSEILSNHKVDGVFHFAAKSIVVESEEKPFYYFQSNFTKSAIFFETLMEHKIKNIVFSSTSSTYGTNLSENSLSEESPQAPTNAYAVSKKLVEDMLVYLSKKYQINVAILRYFNVAGSDPSFTIGENHNPETHLIPNLCLSHLNKEAIKFKLYGDNYSTPDGTCIRDYIHVCDLAKVHEQAYDYVQKKSGLHVFNLGSGTGYSVKEVLKTFTDVTGSSLQYEVCPPRENDPPRLVCNVAKAERELGFSREYSLQNCIEHTLGYLKTKG